VTTQQIGSFLRQALAILGIVFGVLTASVSSLHLPVAVSTALTIGGSIILAIEHYVSDPSTGTPITPISSVNPETAATVTPIKPS
jgi:hypothetical protein